MAVAPNLFEPECRFSRARRYRHSLLSLDQVRDRNGVNPTTGVEAPEQVAIGGVERQEAILGRTKHQVTGGGQHPPNVGYPASLSVRDFESPTEVPGQTIQAPNEHPASGGFPGPGRTAITEPRAIQGGSASEIEIP